VEKPPPEPPGLTEVSGRLSSGRRQSTDNRLHDAPFRLADQVIPSAYACESLQGIRGHITSRTGVTAHLQLLFRRDRGANPVQ